MKKLLFFTVAIGFAVGLHAQQVPVRESAPIPMIKQSAEKMTVEPMKSATILNAEAQQSHKATTANYTYKGTISNAEWTSWGSGGQPSRLGTVTLFPDSLASIYVRYTDNLDSGRSNVNFAGAGFTFDPYSASFSEFGNRNYFDVPRVRSGQSGYDTMHGYMVDTIYFLARYVMPNGFNPSSPDTVRFYAFTQNVHDTLSSANRDYYSLYWPGDASNKQAMGPQIEYVGPILDKGHGTARPKGDYIFDNYILMPEDTNESAGENSFYLSPIVWVPNEGIEVPPGHTLTILVEYIPGFSNYTLGDTIVSFWYNNNFPDDDDRHFVGSTPYMNQFGIGRWEYKGSTGDGFYPNFKDGNGYNTFLMEDMDIRYASDTQDFGNGTFYNPGWSAFPEFYFSVNQSNEYLVRKRGEPGPGPAVAEIGNIVSSIYPNPATTQLTIDLKEQGNAELTIYNMLGQALKQEPLSDMQNTVDIANLSAGIYMVKVIQNNKSHTIKLMKE